MKYSLTKGRLWMIIFLWSIALIIMIGLGVSGITGSLDVSMFGVDVSGAPTLSSVVSAGSLSLILFLNGIFFWVCPRLGWCLFFVLNVQWMIYSVWNFFFTIKETQGGTINLTFLVPLIILVGIMAPMKKKQGR